MGDVMAHGDPAEMDKALVHYAQSLALAEELKMRPLVARVQLGLGRLHRRMGIPAKAEEHLGAALTLSREMDMRFWSARAAEELMELGTPFVVARSQGQLFEYLKQEFAGEPFTVILDRRQSERRQSRETSLGEERRRIERRRHQEADEALRARGFVVLRDTPTRSEETGPV